ncbi:MAG: DUF2891 family protein [Caulobacteraceae bacterium]
MLDGPQDLLGPCALHPIFYGSFDWHSCVHGYWTLARILRLQPDIPEAADIRALFGRAFTATRSSASGPTSTGHPRAPSSGPTAGPGS